MFDPQRFWFISLLARFWFISLLALASFYLLMILLAFIFFWLIAKPKFALISIVAMLLAWVPIKHLLKLRIAHQFEIKKPNTSLRVMSWNVEHFKIAEHKKHPEKKAWMLALIKNYNPDVACFQEMVASDKNPEAINSLPAIIKELQMPYYYYSYNTKLDFDNDHRFGIIILSKYPLINKETVSYSPNNYNSIFQHADVIKGTDTFRIFNLHLQTMQFTNENRQYIEAPEMENEADIKKSLNVVAKLKLGLQKRKLQSERIKKEMKESHFPLIVCGDFNDVPNSYAYKTIGKGLKNTFAEKGAGIGRTYSHMSPTLRIDNIFVDKNFKVEQFVRVNKNVSDHYPIITDLYYNKP